MNIFRFFLVLFIATYGLVYAKCLPQDDKTNRCRYEKGDSWCVNHDKVNLYAYSDSCLKELTNVEKKALNPKFTGTLIDKKGNSVFISKIQRNRRSNIDILFFEDFEISFPIEKVSKLEIDNQGKNAKLTLVNNKIFNGKNPSCTIQGEWDFGEYNINCNKIKSLILKGHPKTEPFKPESTTATIFGSKGGKIEDSKLFDNWNTSKEFLDNFNSIVKDFGLHFSIDKIDKIEFLSKKKKVKITLISGKVYDGTFNYWKLYGKTSFGKYEIKTENISSIVFKGHPKTNSKIKPNLAIVISSNGDKVNAISLGEIKITDWQPEHGFPILIGSIEYYVDIDIISKIVRSGNEFIIYFSNGEQMNGVVADFRFFGEFIYGKFSLDSKKIKEINFKAPREKVEKPYTHYYRPALIIDKDGKQVNISNTNFYGDSHQCGNCIGCCAGGSFNKPYIPVILNSDKIQIKLSKLKKIHIKNTDNYNEFGNFKFNFTSKNDANISALGDDSLLNAYCECREGFGFIGASEYGNAFIRIDNVKTIEFLKKLE